MRAQSGADPLLQHRDVARGMQSAAMHHTQAAWAPAGATVEHCRHSLHGFGSHQSMQIDSDPGLVVAALQFSQLSPVHPRGDV